MTAKKVPLEKQLLSLHDCYCIAVLEEAIMKFSSIIGIERIAQKPSVKEINGILFTSYLKFKNMYLLDCCMYFDHFLT